MESALLPCKFIPPKLIEFQVKTPRIRLPVENVSRATYPSATDAYLISLCSKGRVSEAISSLDSLAERRSSVSSKTFSYLIQSCIDSRSIELSRTLHRKMDVLLKDLDPFTETKLLGMYAKCGCLQYAYELFDEMCERNLYAWSAMIGACCRERRWDEVVELFYMMMMEDGIVPDCFLFPKILQACSNCGDVETGRLIHALVIKTGMNSEIRVSNAILAVYAKCGCLDSAKRFFDNMEVRDTVSWNAIITGYREKCNLYEARRLFELMRKEGVEPGLVTWNILLSSFSRLGECDMATEMMEKMEDCGLLPDIFTWTAMISGFAHSNRMSQAFEYFYKMLLAGVHPNSVTLVSLISACASLKDLRKGRELHGYGLKAGLVEDVLVGNSLIDMYSKCLKLEAALQVFDRISAKDVYTWNSIITGHCQAGYCGRAHDLFIEMQDQGMQPNVITWNAMVIGYMLKGDEDRAMDIFQRMEKDGGVKRDSASWNALIAGYLRNGKKDKALGIFRQMQFLHMEPNAFTILGTLPACANLIAAKKVKEIHSCVVRRHLGSELSVMNSLLDTYVKSGNINYARAIFDTSLSKDIITWNAMIAGYVLHGCPNNAIGLFKLMRKMGLPPNRGTFVSVISAYGLAKKVDEGKRIFNSMTKEYNIAPSLEHCVAMISLFGRSGELEAAIDFINKMNLELNSSVWSILLTASHSNRNGRLAVYAGEQLLKLEPENALVHRLVLQLHALYGASEDSLKLIKPRQRRDVKESLDWSYIEDKNKVHCFVGGHHQKNLKALDSLMKSIGVSTKEYSKWHLIEEEGDEETSGIHSEKLAFDFVLTKSLGTSQCIRIVKSVRMCDNCHKTAKFISNNYGCQIYLRDSKCLHHFKDGFCSCGDYW